MNRNLLALLLALGLASTPAIAQNQDIEGSKDHPLISRYPGSYIVNYIQKEFDEFDLPVSKLADGKFSKTEHLEGKITYIHYEVPAGRSELEIFRNFQTALQQAGFQTEFTCARDQCGSNDSAVLYPNSEGEWFGPNTQTRYLAAKLRRPEGDVHVSLLVQSGDPNVRAPWAYLYVVETKPMESGLVKVNAESLAGDISRTGHASVYGIYFDTGKADVKPESDATLKEIAKLLEAHGDLKLYVVGHTDNQGGLDMNMDLSRRRGDAVVKVLTAKYSVAAARLRAAGDGPTAPVASNETEDGRSKNRRVELVKQ